MTAVCSDLVVAIVASTAGFGMEIPGWFPALQAITPANTTVNNTADQREDKLDITTSCGPNISLMEDTVWLESRNQQKVTRLWQAQEKTGGAGRNRTDA